MPRRANVLIAATTLVLLFLVLRLNQTYRSGPQQPRPLHEIEPPASKPDLQTGTLKASNLQNPVPDVATQPLRNPKPSYIFAFGDSYTTYGFESDGDPPSNFNPLGNRVPINDRTNATQLVTSAAKWLDFLISDYSPPQTLAYNFARGASTIDDEVVAPQFWGAKSLVTQSKEFIQTAAEGRSSTQIGWTVENSAFVIWFGINDVANTAEDKELDLNSVYLRVADSYVRVLKELYAVGARRFLLLTVPPIDRTPSLILMGPPHTFSIAGASYMFNETLSQKIESWASSQGAAGARILATQPIFHRVLDAKPEDATCSVEEKESCAWVDMFHPAEKLQRAVGKEVAKSLRELGMWK